MEASYVEFLEYLNNDRVEEVHLSHTNRSGLRSSDKMYFYTSDSSQLYVAPDPQHQSLRLELLEAGVEVRGKDFPFTPMERAIFTFARGKGA